jgi:ABC-type uncharacterized transport system substrate-binding protein
MNLFVKHDEFNINYLQFLNTKKNLIMDGNFTKIIYSNEIMTMTGLFVEFNFDRLEFPLYIENIQNNFVCDKWNIIATCIIETIKNIEHEILKYYKEMYFSNKKMAYSNNLQHSIRSYKNNETKLLFKISGIWETEFEIGITYKILYN